MLKWFKTASNGLTPPIKVVTSGKGVSNLISAKTETTEKFAEMGHKRLICTIPEKFSVVPVFAEIKFGTPQTFVITFISFIYLLEAVFTISALSQ